MRIVLALAFVLVAAACGDACGPLIVIIGDDDRSVSCVDDEHGDPAGVVVRASRAGVERGR